MGWGGMGVHISTGSIAGIHILSAALVLALNQRWVTPSLCYRLLTKLYAAKRIQLFTSVVYRTYRAVTHAGTVFPSL